MLRSYLLSRLKTEKNFSRPCSQMARKRMLPKSTISKLKQILEKRR